MLLKDRVTSFWEWFSQNSDTLRRQLADGDAAQAADDVKGQLGNIFPELFFELYSRDGKPCMELAPMGDPLNRIVMVYLVGQAPVEVQRDWQLYASRIAKKGVMSWNGIQLTGQDILVIPVEVRNSSKLTLRLVCDKLAKVKDKDKFAITYLMLYEYIGEELCEALIQQVEYIGKIGAKRYTPDQILPLSQLDNYLRNHIDLTKFQEINNKGLIYEYYSGKPQRQKTAKRYDILEGYTALMPLAHEYYDQGGPVTATLAAMGITAGYINLPTSTLKADMLESIKRMLVESLGDSGALIGFAQGELWCYFDILLYSGTLAGTAAALSKGLGGAAVLVDNFTNGV